MRSSPRTTGMVEVPNKIDQFALRGGLDLHTPLLSLKPGVARDSQNWEASITGGYSRIAGYERSDGRPSPTDSANYAIVTLDTVAGLVVGDAINGATSGATGVVAAIDGLNVVYTKTVGTMVDAENFRVAAVVIGVITEVGPIVEDRVKIAEYTLAAANIYRADITAVPGAGSVLGGFSFGGSNYAWRNNAGVTAAVLHKSSVAGWTAVALPLEVGFSNANLSVEAGDTLTQGGVTATIARVMVQTGTLASGTNTGRLIVTAVAGGNFAAGAATSTGGGALTLSGAQTQIAFLPSGRFEHFVGNAGNGVRVYGCDGVNRGWEFDGTTLCPIATGNAVDTPTHVRVHANHLFFSFAASAQHSGIGDPYNWSVVAGAAEIGVDSTINGFITLPGSQDSKAMAILQNTEVSILYGTSEADWNKVDLGKGVGSKAYATQALSTTYLFDDLGIAALSAVQQYGNFDSASLTTNIRGFVKQRRTLVADSLINKEKSQYRVFFSDGYGLYLTIVNGKMLGAMPVSFTNAVTASWSGESANGNEVSYFGSTNGMVYRLDIGTSFDGEEIEHFCELAFTAQGNARVNKRYRRAVVELQGEGYAQFGIGYSLSYGTSGAASSTLTADVSSIFWDSFVWDEFVWDGRSVTQAQVRLAGTAENIAFRFEGTSALWPEFTINSISIHYTPRRILHN
jgi:hypothetical protein